MKVRAQSGLTQFLIFLLMVIMLIRCDFIRMKKEEGVTVPVRKTVARVNDKYLYQDELTGIVDQNSTAEDSAARVNNTR